MRRSLYTLLAVMLVAVMTPFSFVAPVRQAHAESSGSWQLAEVHNYSHAGKSTANHTFDTTESSIKANFDVVYKNTSSSAYALSDYTASWSEWISWDSPSDQIPVGSEADFTATIRYGYSDYKYEEKARNPIGEEPTPDFDFSGSISFGVYDPSKTSLKELFTSYGQRYEAADEHDAAFDDLDFWRSEDNLSYASMMLVSGELKSGNLESPIIKSLKDADIRSYLKEHPSNSFSDTWYPRASLYDTTPMKEFKTPEEFVNWWNKNSRNKVDKSKAVMGMAIVFTAEIYGDEATTVYVYTYNPNLSGAASDKSTGSQNVTINTDASKDKGESGGTANSTGDDSGGWIIPAAIVLGVVVVGGIGMSAARRNKKPKGGLPPDKGSGTSKREEKQEEQQPQSTFRMVLWKDFGDTLAVGAPPQKVGARIEELKSDGSVAYRPDLTAKITFAVSENLKAQATGMQGPYQCINVQAVGPLKSNEDIGIVSIKFTGEGGSFTNNVRFKVRELQIEFPDVPLTFVAGGKQTFEMPFKFTAEDIAKGVQPRFNAHFNSADAERNFKDVHVIPDPDFPDKLFAVQLTECGPISEDDIPGTMQRFTCDVEAVLPASAAGGQELKITGSFEFFRFREGLRFTVEPLKCYCEKYVQEGKQTAYLDVDGAFTAAASAQATALGMGGVFDGAVMRQAIAEGQDQASDFAERNIQANDQVTLVNADEALTMAANLQSAALGQAGAFNAGIVQPAVEKGMRETARTVQQCFPELFRMDDVYVFDRRDKVMLTPARSHAYLTLYVCDEFVDEEGNVYVRPATPLPAPKDMMLSFVDVDGSSVLHDEKGRAVEHPAEVLDFRYFIKDVKRTDNTVVLEILPTKGIMVPPNRAQVDVAAVVQWKDRTFTAKERVNAISQPYRIDYEEKSNEYIAFDDKRTEGLRHIQEIIQGRYTGEQATEGGKSFGEFMFDLLDDITPDSNPSVSLMSTADESVLKNTDPDRLFKYTRKEKEAVYYDDLMPMYHYIEMMIEGHAYEFGYFDLDYERVTKTFERFRQGKLGSAEAIADSYYGHDVEFADALSMTVQEWNRSWAIVGARVGFALFTAGQTELLFIPIQAITNGMEASLEYIDHGGDNLLEAYRVGFDRAGKFALKEGAMIVGMNVAAKCVKTAWVIGKEGFAQRKLFAKALKEMFSSAKYGQGVAQAATELEMQVARAEMLANSAIRTYRGGAQVGVAINREIAYSLGRVEGGVKLDALKDIIAGSRGLSPFQQRAVVVAIQSDKHAMRALMEATGPEADAMRSFFSRAIGQIEKDTLLRARTTLSTRLKIPMNKLRVKGTSGNTGKVSMDLDATFQYYDDATGAWADVDARIGQEAFDAEFYKIVKGYAAESDDVAAAFARQADMTITDAWHPEAYSPDYADALRVIDKTRAGEAFTYGSKVANVAKYKCDHWLQLAKRAATDADAAKAAGKLLDAQRLAASSEAFAEESARQFTKQADRLIINKLAAMQAQGIKARTSVNINLFLEKVAVLKKSGMGRFGGTGLTSGEVDAVLKKGYETSLDALYQELETLTVELDNAIKAAAK